MTPPEDAEGARSSGRDRLADRLAALRTVHEDVQSRLDAAVPGPTKVGALTLYVYSTRGLDRLDRVAASPWWDRWARLSVRSILWVQLSGVALLVLATLQGLSRTRTTALNDPVNAVAVPGLNAFMPLAATPYVVAGLVFATVVHEAGHAIACRAADVSVREWGVALLLGVVPLAGYVLPGDELDDAPRAVRLRVYAVGVFHNLVATALAGAVLLAPVTAAPETAFHAYFGWAAAGGTPPTAATVAALGPLTNLAFWAVLLNVNFGLLNALPVAVFDGGRVLSLWLEGLADRWPAVRPARRRAAVVHGASLAVGLLLVLALVGPHLWT